MIVRRKPRPAAVVEPESDRLQREIAERQALLSEIEAGQRRQRQAEHAALVAVRREQVGKVEKALEQLRVRARAANERAAAVQARRGDLGAATGRLLLGEIEADEAERQRQEIDAEHALAAAELEQAELAVEYVAQRLAEAGRLLAELLPDADAERVRAQTDPLVRGMQADRDARNRDRERDALRRALKGDGAALRELPEPSRSRAQAEVDRQVTQAREHTDASRATVGLPSGRETIERAEVRRLGTFRPGESP